MRTKNQEVGIPKGEIALLIKAAAIVVDVHGEYDTGEPTTRISQTTGGVQIKIIDGAAMDTFIFEHEDRCVFRANVADPKEFTLLQFEAGAWQEDLLEEARLLVRYSHQAWTFGCEYPDDELLRLNDDLED